MNFMTLGDNGQMLPVHQCLRIMAGNDFEKCAREYTIFHYNNMNPGFETHTKFWNGRKFEVLMVPSKTYKDAVWVKAEVNNWEEYNMESKSLNLMMISCEENPPYGPSKDTAIMFLELLCQAYERKCSLLSTTVGEISREQQMANNGDTILTISITVYHAQSKNDYPLTSSEWSSYDGVLIPGSLSAAYDTHIEWIEKLQSVIRNDIHKMRLKTMGVCFGHQCFAHAFGTHGEDGGREDRAIKCPTGSKAGRIVIKLFMHGDRS